MTSPAPSPTLSKRRFRGVRLAVALLVVAVAGIAVSTCVSSTKPILGTCTNADNTVFAYNITEQQCVTSCPTCTWHQNQ